MSDKQTQVADAPPAWLGTLLAHLQPQQGLTPESLKAIVEAAGMNTAQAMKVSLRPENQNSAPNSVYHPLGEDKPSLSRETFICYIEQREDTLTPEEIRALNAISRSTTARNGTWKATVEQNGGSERLLITFPSLTRDDLMALPPLSLLCRELQGGPAAVDVAALVKEVERLKGQLETITA